MDKLSELEQRLDEYKNHSFKAEQMALQKLALYPPFNRPMTAVDILRRELLRHHTRTLLLDEMKQWILELKGMRLYQLYTMAAESSQVMFAYSVRQYMTDAKPPRSTPLLRKTASVYAGGRLSLWKNRRMRFE